MQELIQADIFFFISSIGFVFLAILFGIAAYYIIRAAREIEGLAKDVREEVEDIAEDLDELREKITSKAWFVAKFLEVLATGAIFKSTTRGKKKKKD